MISKLRRMSSNDGRLCVSGVQQAVINPVTSMKYKVLHIILLLSFFKVNLVGLSLDDKSIQKLGENQSCIQNGPISSQPPSFVWDD